MHPLTNDLSKLTDDELHKKREELQKRLTFAYRMGHSQMVNQLQMISEDYNAEVIRRNQKMMDEINKKSSGNHQDKIQIG